MKKRCYPFGFVISAAKLEILCETTKKYSTFLKKFFSGQNRRIFKNADLIERESVMKVDRQKKQRRF